MRPVFFQLRRVLLSIVVAIALVGAVSLAGCTGGRSAGTANPPAPQQVALNSPQAIVSQQATASGRAASRPSFPGTFNVFFSGQANDLAATVRLTGNGSLSGVDASNPANEVEGITFDSALDFASGHSTLTVSATGHGELVGTGALDGVTGAGQGAVRTPFTPVFAAVEAQKAGTTYPQGLDVNGDTSITSGGPLLVEGPLSLSGNGAIGTAAEPMLIIVQPTSASQLASLVSLTGNASIYGFLFIDLSMLSGAPLTLSQPLVRQTGNGRLNGILAVNGPACPLSFASNVLSCTGQGGVLGAIVVGLNGSIVNPDGSVSPTPSFPILDGTGDGNVQYDSAALGVAWQALPVPTETFTLTGSMATARYSHTATLLATGLVLIAGGNHNGPTTSAELYDPATGTFTPTGSMTHARAYHRATLLANGRVLVTGGYFNTSSAELYDPSTGTFTTTGSMATRRVFHTATLLPDNTVLVVGGYNGQNTLATAELYNPATGTFTQTTGSMTAARYDHTATLLPEGTVLVAGGYNTSGAGYPASAELYNPATGTFTSTGSLNTPRSAHTATLLPNGRVLIGGGQSSNSLASAELYDPSSRTFTPTGSMTSARFAHTATLLPDGSVLVAGGDDSGNSVILASAELYDPATGTFTPTRSMMTTARYSHTATLLPDGLVLVAGGSNNDVGVLGLDSAELYYSGP